VQEVQNEAKVWEGIENCFPVISAVPWVMARLHKSQIIIIIIIINCNWVVTRWQWLFYMYINIYIY